MNDRERTKKAVKAIRDATGLTQAEFAERIGASVETVKHWTGKKPRAMDADFERRILHAFGAQIERDGSILMHVKSVKGKEKNGVIVRPVWYHKPYDELAYEWWKFYGFPTSAESFSGGDAIKIAIHNVEVTLKAAAIKGNRLGTKFQLNAVLSALDLFLKKTVRDFDLSDRIAQLEKNTFQKVSKTPKTPAVT